TENKHFGDDFINKTFSVVYRVAPPILSDWKSYFVSQWNEAFRTDPVNNVLQIFDSLNDEITPRKIIAFINEFVSIKLIIKDSIPKDDYVALFILGKEAISKSPNEILVRNFMNKISNLYSQDEELPRYLAALFYQV